VQLFDFGLAKEYDPSKADKNGCYPMTAFTGSLRYMAPEVALGKPCNETIDVHSFGLLLYHILALEAPFEGLTAKSFPKFVFEKGARPVPDPKWPAEISSLMRMCWSPNIEDRPSMAEVVNVLKKDIDTVKALNKPEGSRHAGKRNVHIIAEAAKGPDKMEASTCFFGGRKQVSVFEL